MNAPYVSFNLYLVYMFKSKSTNRPSKNWLE